MDSNSTVFYLLLGVVNCYGGISDLFIFMIFVHS